MPSVACIANIYNDILHAELTSFHLSSAHRNYFGTLVLVLNRGSDLRHRYRAGSYLDFLTQLHVSSPWSAAWSVVDWERVMFMPKMGPGGR